MADCIDKIRLLNDPLFITLKVEQFMFYVSGQKLFILQICTCAIYKNQTQNSNEQKKKYSSQNYKLFGGGLKKIMFNRILKK